MTETLPERIHGWRQTQLSIARFYGSIRFNGYSYVIAETEPGQPLVRLDVLERERKERAGAKAKGKELQSKDEERQSQAQGQLK